MKKLLLVTKSILIISLVFSCSSAKNKKSISEKSNETEADSIIPRAIIHTAPEQAKIDSIKAAKEKERKNP